MTLNLMLTSRTAVYLSGDFRLTYPGGRWEDDPLAQKLVPVFKFGWSALVSFAGIAKTARGIDVGDWLSEQLQDIEMNAKFEELPRRLLAPDAWLSKLAGSYPLAFSVVGFIGRRPVAMVISNFTDINGHIFDPLKPRLKRFESKPKEPEIRVAGDARAVPSEERKKLKKMLIANVKPSEIGAALANVNAAAASRSSTISRACIIGHLLPTGAAEVTPYAVGERGEYVPGFVKRGLLTSVLGFKRKVDENGRPLPPRWKGMTARVQGRRGKEAIVTIHAFANVEEPLGGE